MAVAEPTRPAALVLDFDGTTALADVGDALCRAHAEPSWLSFAERFNRGELGLKEAQVEMWARYRADLPTTLATIDSLSALRPGLERLLEVAEAARIPVWLASGGFTLYVDRILGPLRPRFAGAIANTLAIEGERATPHFADERWSCGRCAVCKGRVVDQLAAALNGPVWFCGDGASDRCVLDRPVRLFAVAGSSLERLACEQGRGCEPFETFLSVAEALGEAVARGAAGSPTSAP